MLVHDSIKLKNWY